MKTYKPVTSGLRFRQDISRADLSKKAPEKSLLLKIKSHGGRNAAGRVTVRHRGGGTLHLFRAVDFLRNKDNITAKVTSIEYDPNRGASIALLSYQDGEKRYIPAPLGLKIGDTVISGVEVEPVLGNNLPLERVPVGMPIHNLELHPGRGGQIVRGAGTAAMVTAREEKGYVQVKLPSGEVRKFLAVCRATVGQLGNIDRKNVKLGKAGRSRMRGIRPTVRGVAQHPGSHPHGGGEGRSGLGMPGPKTPWGKPARGVKTRRRHHTNKYIVSRRGGLR